jgi:hypothetical protein
MPEKAMDLEVLEKVRKAAPKKAERVTKKTHAPAYREAPKGQAKGPFGPAPAELVVCVTCSHMFSTPDAPVRVGVRKRHAAKHLSDHRMGRIKRPKEAK